MRPPKKKMEGKRRLFALVREWKKSRKRLVQSPKRNGFLSTELLGVHQSTRGGREGG